MRAGNDPMQGRMTNPKLELYGSSNELIEENDDWAENGDKDRKDKEESGLAPSDEKEAAIVRRLNPGTYTAILRDRGAGGIGLVEMYDLESNSGSKMANISTRGTVGLEDDVVIGGIILRGNNPQKVLLRAIGPDLGRHGISGALEDPTLALHDEDGNLVVENDNWKESQREEIEATGIPPNDERESAVVRVLGAGNYTAIVRGKENGSGVGLVELYNIGKP